MNSLIKKQILLYNNKINTKIFDNNDVYKRELIDFNKEHIFISYKSFKQNGQIANKLRKDINALLNNICGNYSNKGCYFIAIGGESYLYGLTNKYINHIIHYTNSLSIYNDVIKNSYYINNNYIENYLIDYNTFQNYKNGEILIINNSKLNLTLLNMIKNRYYKYIIIINCHHTEFWNRIKILHNYRIISRTKYVTKYYYVSVTILQYKEQIPIFIPLGGNCATAYHLTNIGLRKKAFPFDWCKMNIKQLNNVLTNDFQDFNKLIFSKYSNKHSYLFKDNIGSFIVKNKYNITFAHEIVRQSTDDLDKFVKKLNGRIEKFKNLKNKPVIFIIFDYYEYSHLLLALIKNLQKYFNYFKIIYIYTNNNKIVNNKVNNFNFIKYIKIDHKLIDWSDWSLSSLNWFDIILNNEF